MPIKETLLDIPKASSTTHIVKGFVEDEKLPFIQDVLFGLSQKQKCLSSKYFYDEQGSKIFQEIMQLEEYYLTRAETNILYEHKHTLLELMRDEHFNLIDLGSGDGIKTRILLEHLTNSGKDFTYYPVDISGSILETQLRELDSELPYVKANALVGEYYDALRYLKNLGIGRKLVLLLGANVGNFTHDDTLRFLQTLWHLLDSGDTLLIGFDLKKDPAKILNAYSDSKGVTARFNYNLLRRINRELGGNFDIKSFNHYASYDPISGVCRSFLLSLKDQTIYIDKLSKTFEFKACEAIHTEYSFKYSFCDIHNLALDSGFTVLKDLTDKENTFVDSLWKVIK